MANAFWTNSVNAAVYLKNRFPSRALKVWTSRKPDLSNVKTFGYKEVRWIREQKNICLLDAVTKPKAIASLILLIEIGNCFLCKLILFQNYLFLNEQNPTVEVGYEIQIPSTLTSVNFSFPLSVEHNNENVHSEQGLKNN